MRNSILLLCIALSVLAGRLEANESHPPQPEVPQSAVVPLMRHMQALQVELRNFEAAMAERCHPSHPSCPPLTLTGELRGGAGTSDSASAFIEGRLALKHLPLDITATALVRHFFDDSGYWIGKRKLVLGASLPLSRDLSVFSEWERKYSTGDDWFISGVSLKFTAFGRR